MGTVLWQLGVAMLGNLVFWLGLGLVVCLYLRARRTSLLRFFGLSRSPALVVYLSNLWDPNRVPHGEVISGHESHVVRAIDDLLGNAPDRFPEPVRGLVDAFWFGTKPQVRHQCSPIAIHDLPPGSMIVVGTGVKNEIRRHFLTTNMVELAFVDEPSDPPADILNVHLNPNVRVRKGRRIDEILEAGPNRNLAIIEKISDRAAGTVVLMCAGWRGDSSQYATIYLLRHWRELQNRFKDNDFALCLAFPKGVGYMQAYEEPGVIYP